MIEKLKVFFSLLLLASIAYSINKYNPVKNKNMKKKTFIQINDHRFDLKRIIKYNNVDKESIHIFYKYSKRDTRKEFITFDTEKQKNEILVLLDNYFI